MGCGEDGNKLSNSRKTENFLVGFQALMALYPRRLFSSVTFLDHLRECYNSKRSTATYWGEFTTAETSKNI
jgi:DNA phosphorothioation-dependent restriction protein DptG